MANSEPSREFDFFREKLIKDQEGFERNILSHTKKVELFERVKQKIPWFEDIKRNHLSVYLKYMESAIVGKAFAESPPGSAEREQALLFSKYPPQLGITKEDLLKVSSNLIHQRAKEGNVTFFQKLSTVLSPSEKTIKEQSPGIAYTMLINWIPGFLWLMADEDAIIVLRKLMGADRPELPGFQNSDLTILDIKDLPSFAEKINQEPRFIDLWLRPRLSTPLTTALDQYAQTNVNDSNLCHSLVVELNGIINGPLIYGGSHFYKVNLRPKTKRQLSCDSDVLNIPQLNRWLLEDAYKGIISGGSLFVKRTRANGNPKTLYILKANKFPLLTDYWNPTG
jgi:hypothetical protein